MTLLDILREKLVGKTIVSGDRGNNNSIVGAKILGIYLDEYEPMFNLTIEKNGIIESISYLSDWNIEAR